MSHYQKVVGTDKHLENIVERQVLLQRQNLPQQSTHLKLSQPINLEQQPTDYQSLWQLG